MLLDFNFSRKTKYETFLEVELSFVPRPREETLVKRWSVLPWERETGEPYRGVKLLEQRGQKERLPDEERKLKKWDKFLEHQNELPNKRLFKYDTSEQGAFRLKFSHSGRFLAAACTISQKPSKTLIKIFDIEDTESSEEKIVLKGHHDLVHDL